MLSVSLIRRAWFRNGCLLETQQFKRKNILAVPSGWWIVWMCEADMQESLTGPYLDSHPCSSCADLPVGFLQDQAHTVPQFLWNAHALAALSSCFSESHYVLSAGAPHFSDSQETVWPLLWYIPFLIFIFSHILIEGLSSISRSMVMHFLAATVNKYLFVVL